MQEDFEARGCNNLTKNGNLSLQSYAHSEQAFISQLLDLKRNGQKNQIMDTGKYSSIVLLFVSTNEPCDNCSGALVTLLKNTALGDHPKSGGQAARGNKFTCLRRIFGYHFSKDGLRA